MYVGVGAQRNYGTSFGSCHDLVMYLEKENEGLEEDEKTGFFNQYRDDISPYKVINAIDNNVKGLKDNEAKFYTLLLSPNQRELEHIRNSPEHLKAYTQDVMNAYAAHFNRTIDSRPLKGDDLVWFARVEEQRTYNRFDKSVAHNTEIDILRYRQQENPGDKALKKALQKLGDYKRTEEGAIIREGIKKEGAQAHVHVIISRKDASQKLSLSPLANAKGGEVPITRYLHNGEVIPKTKAMRMVLEDIGVTVRKDPASKKMVFEKEGIPMPKEKAQELFESNSALMEKKGITKMVEKAEIGFNRDAFYQKAEDIFDYKFSYQRKFVNSYRYKNAYKNGMDAIGNHIKARLKNEALTLGGNVVNVTKPLNTLNALTKIPVDPVTLGIKVIKQAVTKVIEAGLAI